MWLGSQLYGKFLSFDKYVINVSANIIVNWVKGSIETLCISLQLFHKFTIILIKTFIEKIEAGLVKWLMHSCLGNRMVYRKGIKIVWERQIRALLFEIDLTSSRYPSDIKQRLSNHRSARPINKSWLIKDLQSDQGPQQHIPDVCMPQVLIDFQSSNPHGE